MKHRARRMRILAGVATASLLLLAASAAPSQAADRSVRRSELLPVDGAHLFLLLRGADRDAPLLLWLHGGPGGAERPLFRYFDADLEASFVVAYWDQRGAGRSFDPDADPAALRVARHLADLAAVVAHLKQAFHRERVVLLGHSWGGALGLLYAREHPEDVAALVAVDPLVSARAGNQAEYAFVLEEAARRGDADAAAEARRIGPPPYRDASQVLALERLADGFGAVYHRPPSRGWVVLSGMLRGLLTPWEIPALIRGNQVSLAAMHDELQQLDLRTAVPALEVPVVFLLGRHDRHADARLAADYFAALRAPAKQLVWFEDSAHNPPFEEPQRFVATVVSALARLGVGAGAPARPPPPGDD